MPRSEEIGYLPCSTGYRRFGQAQGIYGNPIGYIFFLTVFEVMHEVLL